MLHSRSYLWSCEWPDCARRNTSWWRLLAPIVYALLPSAALGDYVELRRSANFYRAPDKASVRIESIDPADLDETLLLPIVAGDSENGYYNVRLPSGLAAWVYRTRVRRFPGDPPIVAPGIAAFVYGGAPDVSQLDDAITVVENLAYAAAYSEARWNPLWVAYRVQPEAVFSCPRLTRFRTDDRVLSGVTHNDYTGTGYDRGHMAPSAGIGSRHGCDAQNETYFLSNIAPQLPRLNQKAWAAFEQVVADQYAPAFGGVWVLTGPIFDTEILYRLCSDIEIPVAFYKIVIRETMSGLDALALIMSQDTVPGTSIAQLVTSIDEIERRTQLDFLQALPDEIEARIEEAQATASEWLLNSTLNTTFAGAARERCELPPIPRASYPYDF